MEQNLAKMIGSDRVGKPVHIYFDTFAMLSSNFMDKFIPELFEIIDNCERGYSVVIHPSVLSFFESGKNNMSLPVEKRQRNAKLLEFISNNQNESDEFYFEQSGSGDGIQSFIESIMDDQKQNQVILFSDGIVLNNILKSKYKGIVHYSLREYCLNRYAKQAVIKDGGPSFRPYKVKSEPIVQNFNNNPRIPVANEVVIVDGEQKKLIGKTGTTGAEASVYVIGDNCVAKIFKPSSIALDKFKKITLMTQVKMNNDNISWPKSIVYNSDGNPVGYTMPYIHAAPLSSLTNKLCFMEDGECELWERSDLVTCALTLAKNVEELHSKGVLFGDFSDNNILVDTQDPNNTNLIDVDDCFIGEYACRHSTPGFRAPEVASEQKGTSYQTELFSLAIVLFDILMVTKDPYSSAVAYGDSEIDALVAGKFPFPKKGKDYKSANTRMGDGTDKMYDNMPQYIKDAFYETFASDGVHFASNRISAKEWVGLLKRYESDLAGDFGKDENANLVLPNGYRNRSESSSEHKASSSKRKVSSIDYRARHHQISKLYTILKTSVSKDSIVSNGKSLNQMCTELNDKYDGSLESKKLEYFVNRLALPLSNVSINNPQAKLDIMKLQELYAQAKAYRSTIKEEIERAESSREKQKKYQSALDKMDEVIEAMKKIPQDFVSSLRAYGLNRRQLRVDYLVCEMELFTFIANDIASRYKGGGEVRTHYDASMEKTYDRFLKIKDADNASKETMRRLYQTRKHNK